MADDLAARTADGAAEENGGRDSESVWRDECAHKPVRFRMPMNRRREAPPEAQRAPHKEQLEMMLLIGPEPGQTTIALRALLRQQLV